MDNTALTTMVTVAASYLLLLRVVDFNEKEPLGALLGFFFVGALGGAALYMAAPILSPTMPSDLALGGPAAVIAKELLRFLAIGLGIAGLSLKAQRTGFHEVNGRMDGVVYGASSGLGFATGTLLIQDILLPAAELRVAAPGSVASIAQVALAGLADGIFGAFIGVGFAMALTARSAPRRIASPIVGSLAAVVAHLAYDYVGHSNSLGDDGHLRKWLALLFPLVIIVIIAALALRAETKAIQRELEDEKITGAVTESELATLQTVALRQKLYLGTLFRGNLKRWSRLHELHNRQVQLALAKDHLRSESESEQRPSSASEIANLRKSIYVLKESLGIAIPAIARYHGSLAEGDDTTLESEGNEAEEEADGGNA